VDAEKQWNYLELTAAVHCAARGMSQAGATADDAVVVLAPLTNEAVATYLGAVLTGSVVVLVDRRCGRADIDMVCAATAPRLVWSTGEHTARLGLGDRLPVLDLGTVTPADVSRGAYGLDRILDPDVASVLVFTSGTTSAPKGVIHTRNSLRCGCANMAVALDFTAGDAFFLSSPLASITGVLQLETALGVHGSVILEERFSPAESLQRLRGHGGTVLGGAPIICEELFAECRRQQIEELPLRCIALGGSMITQPVLDTARRFGILPVRVYGSSEAPFSTATSLESVSMLDDEGIALAGVETTIGASGELLVRGPHTFHGYLDPADNETAFTGEWVRTGDVATIDHGRVRITGRIKDVAIRKGMKISLAELDAAAAQFGDCAVYALDDPATGERVVLAIQGQPGFDASLSAVTTQLLEAGLAKWKLPEQIVVWDCPLPRTPTGKVIRRDLAADSANRPTFYAARLTSARREDRKEGN
jgi:acyl-CoA synthetase (AMP-forming)/AMP-acid ligase II